MKIYFEDGRLKGAEDLPFKYDHKIDAGQGYSVCDYALEQLMVCCRYQDVVYTNFVPALSNKYAWNPELKVSEIYIRDKDGDFVLIDTLTEREIRQAHNIMHMYMANEFGNLG